MNRYVRPNSCCRSRIRLTICAWIDTSSADTGSSQTMKRGLQRQRAGDADALALPAGELVGIAIGVFLAQADHVEQFATSRARLARSPTPWIRSGSPMMSRTVMRGSSEAYGSWKMICICWRRCAHLLRRQCHQVLAGEPHRARASAPPGASTRRPVVVLPQPLSPTSPKVSPAAMSKSTPSTARTAPTTRGSNAPRGSGSA